MSVNLKDVILKQENIKAKEIVYDKDHKVSFDLVFVSKPEFQAMVNKHTHYIWNNKTHQRDETLDTISFHDELIRKCVVGWHGVTFEWLKTQTMLDLSKVKDLKEEIEFNQENLKTLFENCFGLDQWLIETVKNAAFFNEKYEEEIKN